MQAVNRYNSKQSHTAGAACCLHATATATAPTSNFPPSATAPPLLQPSHATAGCQPAAAPASSTTLNCHMPRLMTQGELHICMAHAAAAQHKTLPTTIPPKARAQTTNVPSIPPDTAAAVLLLLLPPECWAEELSQKSDSCAWRGCVLPRHISTRA